MTSDISRWKDSFDVNSKPWLLLGKGPTFRKIQNVNTDEFHICTLNHVIREIPATVAHIIDIDVVADCAEAIDAHARYLVMPHRPHLKCSPTDKTIFQFVSEIPILRKLENEGRLVWYNLSTSKKDPHGDSPVVQVKFFSAEAALNVLATCGVKVVRSLGVDGGATYSNAFSDLKEKTLLANGHSTFDKQFEGIAATIRKTGIFYAPLHVKAPIRVFVGADRAQMAGVKVLEYSIKRFATATVDVVPIDDRQIPVPKNPANRSKTGFSFSRFHIPELCNYCGKAIYLDADMQLFADIMKLWEWPFEGADVLYSEQAFDRGRIPQYSVLLLNCDNLSWNVREIVRGLDNGRYDYKQLMRDFCVVRPEKKRASLPYEWNSLEYYEPGKTCLIHYTDMPTQPWVSNRNKYGQLWYDCLRMAIKENFISRDFVYDEIARGNVSPELPRWVGLQDPPEFQRLRASWLPPYRRFSAPSSSEIEQSSVSASKDRGSLVREWAFARATPPSLGPLIRKVYSKIRKRAL